MLSSHTLHMVPLPFLACGTPFSITLQADRMLFVVSLNSLFFLDIGSTKSSILCMMIYSPLSYKLVLMRCLNFMHSSSVKGWVRQEHRLESYPSNFITLHIPWLGNSTYMTYMLLSNLPNVNPCVFLLYLL